MLPGGVHDVETIRFTIANKSRSGPNEVTPVNTKAPLAVCVKAAASTDTAPSNRAM